MRARALTPRPASPRFAVQFDGITKWYGRTHANDGVSFHVDTGSIHGLVGENGAGKTTLMHVLFGLVEPDAGTLGLWGEPVRFRSPRAALEAGVGMIHQHFSLVPPLTVTENIVLGQEPRRGPRLDWRAARRQVVQLAEHHGLPVDPDARVAELPIGAQQRVEILKALYRNVGLLILDEPTTVLAPSEYGTLVKCLRGFAAGGGTVLFISHRLPEVLDLCETITVMRRGRVVETRRRSEVGAVELARLMVGEAVQLGPKPRAPAPTTPQPPVIAVQHASTPPRPHEAGLDDVSLTVHAGEIVGVAGVAGNGQEALARLLVGTARPRPGRVVWQGAVDWSRVGLRRRRRAGLAWIPADRSVDGIVAGMNVADNLALGRHARPPLGVAGLRRRAAVLAAAAEPMAELRVWPDDPAAPAGALSGGNQQKLLVGRELATEPRLLVAEHPTRGVDVATAQLILDRLRSMRQSGASIVLIASDLTELLNVADRVVVLYRGRVVLDTPAGDTNEVDLAPYLGGAVAGDAPTVAD